MDLLRRVLGTLGGDKSAGLAPDFAYALETLAAPADATGGVWEVHDARALKPDGPPGRGGDAATVLACRLGGLGADAALLARARAGAKRLRTLRHPNVLRHLGGAEVADAKTGAVRAVYVAAERAGPLDAHMRAVPEAFLRSALLLVAHGVLRGVRFLNEDARIAHGALWDVPRSVLVTRAGEARLWGLEDASPSGRSDADAGAAAQLVLSIFRSHGVVPGGGLGALLDAAAGADGPMRPPLSAMVEAVERASAAQGAGDLVGLGAQLDALGVSPDDAGRALHGLAGRRTALVEAVPASYLRHRVLPALEGVFALFPGVVSPDAVALYCTVASSSLGDEAGISADSGLEVETASLSLGNGTSRSAKAAPSKRQELERGTVDTIVALCACGDRAVRAALLSSMTPALLARLDDAAVREGVFPRLAAGLGDASPLLRELSLRTCVSLAPRLTTRQVHNELVRAVHRLQRDAEPGVRVAAASALGRLVALLVSPGAPSDDPGVRAVCGGIFAALGDPCADVRRAGLAALRGASGAVPRGDAARVLLPAACPLLVDAEGDVRVVALACVRDLLSRIESGMADESNCGKAGPAAAPPSSERSARPQTGSQPSGQPRAQSKAPHGAQQVAQSGPQPCGRPDAPPEVRNGPRGTPGRPGVVRTSGAGAPIEHDIDAEENPWRGGRASGGAPAQETRRPLVLAPRGRSSHAHDQ